jgi:lipopolysaccharide export system protein LptA
MTFWRSMLMAAAVATCTMWAGIGTQAQAPVPKGFFLGLTQNRGQPLEIEGELAQLERDSGVEHYLGYAASGVRVKLGDTTIRSRFLTVYYERDGAAAGAIPADLRKAGLVHIRRLEASGNVVLTEQDQIAAGDNAVFDVQANVITFTGNAMITQCENRVQGSRLIANLTTGSLLMEPAGSRVRAQMQNWPSKRY